MLPVSDYVSDGDTIYFAVHAKYADRLDDIAHSVADVDVQDFRLFFIVFGGRLEFVHLCYDWSVIDLPEIISVRRYYHEGDSLDPVIGVVLADHGAVRERDPPTLFVFSDGDIQTYWHEGTLAQVVKFVWLNEPTTEPLLTPFGERREVTLHEGTEAWGVSNNASPVREKQEPSSHVVRRDAMLASVEHTNHSSESNLEAVMARISAEVTHQAAERRATCRLCQKPQQQGCTSGTMTDGRDCPNKPKIL
jgi:hypothetical protein